MGLGIRPYTCTHSHTPNSCLHISDVLVVDRLGVNRENQSVVPNRWTWLTMTNFIPIAWREAWREIARKKRSLRPLPVLQNGKEEREGRTRSYTICFPSRESMADWFNKNQLSFQQLKTVRPSKLWRKFSIIIFIMQVMRKLLVQKERSLILKIKVRI